MKKLMMILFLFLLLSVFSGVGQAVTIGNTPLTSRTFVDSASGGVFIMDANLFPSGPLTVTNWSYYFQKNSVPNTGFLITPLLFEPITTVPNGWEISGIGTTRTSPSSSGIVNESFGLIAGGSSTVDAGYAFGWRLGTADGSTINQGVIPFDNFSTGGGLDWIDNGATALAVGNQFTIPFSGSFNRVYSFSVDAANGIIPEPNTMFLLGFGLIGLAGSRRKLKKK